MKNLYNMLSLIKTLYVSIKMTKKLSSVIVSQHKAVFSTLPPQRINTIFYVLEGEFNIQHIMS